MPLQFSWPTYHASLAVLTTAEVQQAQRGWYFLRPFQGAVWGAIGATLLLIPILAFLLEFLAIQVGGQTLMAVREELGDSSNTAG